MNLLQLQQGASLLTLHGAGLAAPFREAALAHNTLDAAGCALDELTIALRGTPGEIESGLAALARLLENAPSSWELPGAERVYLLARLLPGGAVWRSPIRSARIALAGAPQARLSGSQGVRVALARADWWEETVESALPLASQATSRTTNPVTLRNHWDSAHSNYAQAEAADARGELPAPLRLEYLNSGLGSHGTLYCGQNAASSPSTLACRLEGEAALLPNGTPVESVGTSGCSSSAYGRASWSGTGFNALHWTVSAALQNLSGGAWFLPIARLAVKLAAGEWWGRWKLLYAHAGETSLLWESLPALLDPARGLQPGAPLRLPPWSGAANTLPLTLAWEISAASAGSHTLAVDYVYLLPLESWRIYRPALAYAAGFEVRDDPASASLSGPGGLRAHQPSGPGLVLAPGRLQRWYFLAETSQGDDNPDAAATLRLWYRARKRVL